jgi:tRNA(Ile)-lysidine synthase
MIDQEFNSRQKKHLLFCLKFVEHVGAFIDDHNLLDKKIENKNAKKIILSVSGGVDSVVLVDIFSALEIKFELLHFNHGTRPEENALEEKLVSDLGKKLNVKVNVIYLNLSLDHKNFENVARISRRETYKKFINNDYLIFTAHHLNDSFEWSLMQSFKQSSNASSLGIPVWSRGLVRPFMCVTKKQIYRYARARQENVLWIEDPSNKNEYFERNYLRIKIVKTILNKYPKALKHYVSQQNELSKLFSLHRNNAYSELKIENDKMGSFLFVSGHLENYKNEIKKAIYKKSQSHRGEIDVQIDKILIAHESIMKDSREFPFKGPMNISGGVSLFLLKDHLLIMSRLELNAWKSFDHKLKNHLENMTQIPDVAYSPIFPQIFISKSKKIMKPSNYVHPLLKVTCEWLKNNRIAYTFAPLLSKESKESLVLSAVLLDSSLTDK